MSDNMHKDKEEIAKTDSNASEVDAGSKPQGSTSTSNRNTDELQDKPNTPCRDFLDQSLDFLLSKLSLTKTDEKLIEKPTLEDIIKRLKFDEYKNVITMVGAGISTAAGIPDFRSPMSGLYDNLEKYNLPYPQAIFEIDYFNEKPEAFYSFLKDFMPVTLKPTKAHYFIKLLENKGVLRRHYTQNIDNLDRLAGISDDKIVEAHGSFNNTHCLQCNKSYDLDWLKAKINQMDVPLCESCCYVVKPDIVFFGENLPEKFLTLRQSDFKECDLLIIMGTSLTVEPFASLVTLVPKTCPRIVINQNKVGVHLGLSFNAPDKADLFIQNSCDEGCQKMANILDWSKELTELMGQSSCKE